MIKSAKKEYIFGIDEVTKSCHASTVLPLEDGTVLAAWFGGKREKDNSVEIYLSKRSTDGKWSKPRIVTENDKIAHWNPVLFERENGEIVLFYKYGAEIPTWITKFIVSTDRGETWSKPEELVPGDTVGGRGPVKNKCLRLSNGTVLAPASTELKKNYCFIDVSEDDGKTWKAGEFMVPARYKGKFTGLIQPTLWESEKGTVHCLMRSCVGALYRSDSKDGGKTWCKPYRTHIPNNNSGVDACTDSKGNVWLCYNPVDVNWGVRHPLMLSVSKDNGRTFLEMLNPEPGFGEFSYPAIVCRGNKLHLTYTHKRKQIVYWEIELED